MKDFSLKKIIFNKFFSFILIFTIFLSLCYIDIFPSFLELGIEFLGLVFSLIIIFLYLLNFKFSKFTAIMTLLCIFLSISTLNGDYSSLYDVFKTYYRLLALTYYIDWGIKFETKNLVKSLYYTLYIVVAINFITIVLFPNGLFAGQYINNWFLWYDNTHIFWYMPTLLLSLINLKFENKKLNFSTLILFFMITYSVYYCFSANSVVAYTLFLLFLIFKKSLNKLDFMNAKTYFWIFLILFFMIIIFRVQEIFSWLIVDILNKDLTFTNRTIIWDRVLLLIKDNWLIGYGLENASIVTLKLGNSQYAHAHNTLLNVMYKGGIVATLTFVSLMFESVKKLYKNRKEEISKVVSFVVFCLFIMMLFEAREETIGFYVTFVIAYNINYILDFVNITKTPC